MVGRLGRRGKGKGEWRSDGGCRGRKEVVWGVLRWESGAGMVGLEFNRALEWELRVSMPAAHLPREAGLCQPR